MNKKEAYVIWKIANDLCVNQNECKDCPFYVTEIECCSLINLGNLRVEKCVSAFLAKEDNEISTPSENVKSIEIEVLGRNVEELKNALNNRLQQQEAALNLAHDALIPSSVNAKHDNVNSPKHYCKGGLECINVIKAQLTPEQNKGYLYGNVLKYMWRWPEKNGLEDLRKAEHYLKWLIDEVEKNGGNRKEVKN